MRDYTPVMDCLEAARNKRFCAGAESAMREIERQQVIIDRVALIRLDLESENIRLRTALEEIDTDGVWNECDYCRRKVVIADKALNPDD